MGTADRSAHDSDPLAARVGRRPAEGEGSGRTGGGGGRGGGTERREDGRHGRHGRHVASRDTLDREDAAINARKGVQYRTSCTSAGCTTRRFVRVESADRRLSGSGGGGGGGGGGAGSVSRCRQDPCFQ